MASACGEGHDLFASSGGSGGMASAAGGMGGAAASSGQGGARPAPPSDCAAAQAAENGALGEVDLEMYQDRLVFNIDIGEKDVKVDAADATVLGWVSDD